MTRNHRKGFTLIEVVIYIALFSILLGGAFVTAYQLIDSSRFLGAKNTVQEEGNFVLRKFNWALMGILDVTAPSPSSLVVTKYGGNKVYIELNADKIEMRESSTSFLPITTDNVKVSNLHFEITFSGESDISKIEATATINNIDFKITKFIRK